MLPPASSVEATSEPPAFAVEATTPEPQHSAQPQAQEAADISTQTYEAPAHVQRPAPPQLSPQSDSSEDDDDEEDYGPKPEIVLGPDGLPSLGSSGHATGDCKRCCFFPKNRCTNGHDCRFCHFDHDKRKRLKKKKKKRAGGGSEQQTPSSCGGVTPGSVTTPFGFGGSPLGPGAVGMVNVNRLLGMQPATPGAPSPVGAFAGYPGMPMTPASPHMPPFAPPSLLGIRLNEPPPPPPPPPPASNAAASPVTTTPPPISEPLTFEDPPLQKRPPPLTILEDAEGPAAEATNEMFEKDTEEKASALSLTDLLAAAAPAAEPVPIPLMPPGQMGIPLGKPESPRLAPAPWEQPLPMWPPQTPLAGVAPSPHGGAPLHWPAGYAGAYPPSLQPEWFTPLSTPSGAQLYGLNSPVASPFSPASPAGIPPWFASIPSTPTPVPSEGMNHDSPRTAILMLSGAWGALTTAKTESPKKGQINLPKVDSLKAKAPAEGCLARSELLSFRKAFQGPRPPALKSLRVSRVAQ